MIYKVHDLANIAGVSVRTLHHYDHIGLLIPSQKTQAGYRLYSESDLSALLQILMLKELGFSLKNIQELGVAGALSDKDVLSAQRTVLEKKKARLEQIISALSTMIDTKEENSMSQQDMFDTFDMADIEKAQKQYADEVSIKYPKPLVDACSAKTSKYNKKDWQRVMHAQNDIFAQFAANMQHGTSPDAQSVRALVSAFAKHITDSFYVCDDQCLLDLGELYVSDARFTAYYDNIAPGLAQYIHQAFQSYYTHQK